jgi:hypothetical protein
MTETYEEILQRIPEVTWTPVPGPDHHDLARRFEYTEDRLRKAAEIVWLTVEAVIASTGGGDWTGTDEDRAAWMMIEIQQLRQMLDSWGPMSGVGGTRRDARRARALLIMNLPRTEASSSRRTDPQPSVDAQAAEDAVLAEWAAASAGQG